MIQAHDFIMAARDVGIDFFTGVPCSYLTPLINRVISDANTPYVGATSEGEAIAIAAGAWLGGRLPVVMCQNSGLGNTVNPVTSLNHSFGIPTLMVVTWRGEPGHPDEPQHDLMGEVTHTLLDTIRVPHATFPERPEEIAPRLRAAVDQMRGRAQPYAFVMRKDSVAPEPLDSPPRVVPQSSQVVDRRSHGTAPARFDVLTRSLGVLPDDAAIIATTGKTGRELFTAADREQHLYVVGSMGGASAMGLGVALQVRKPVVVFDGDGAALMKLGNMATIGATAPGNLIHVVLDNGVHDSTGGQETVSPFVDFAAIAAACSYRTATRCDDLAGYERALSDALKVPGPHLIHMRIRPGSLDKLGRPTVKPPEVALRFKAFLAGGAR